MHLCVIKQQQLKFRIMKLVNDYSRAELEIAILENDLENDFGGLEFILIMTDEEIKEKLIEWIMSGDEA